jgi:hypothetical protein
VDLISNRRPEPVPRRLPAERPTAPGRGPIADDEAAGFRRNPGSGMRDDLIAHRRRQDDSFWANGPGRDPRLSRWPFLERGLLACVRI